LEFEKLAKDFGDAVTNEKKDELNTRQKRRMTVAEYFRVASISGG